MPTDDGALEKLPVRVGAHGVVRLRGPSGLVLKLESTGSKEIQWAPIDRQASEVEVRAAVITHSPDGAPASPPLVRLRLQYGHGSATWTQPLPDPPFTGGAQLLKGFVLPSRGAVLRLSAREIFVKAESPTRADHITAPYAYTLVQVSFQPVFGAPSPLFPRCDVCWADNPGALELQGLPMEAQELRIFNVNNGQPFAAGVLNVAFGDSEGGVTVPVDANAMAQFVPIPAFAVLIVGVPVAGPPGFFFGIEYR